MRKTQVFLRAFNATLIPCAARERNHGDPLKTGVLLRHGRNVDPFHRAEKVSEKETPKSSEKPGPFLAPGFIAVEFQNWQKISGLTYRLRASMSPWRHAASEEESAGSAQVPEISSSITSNGSPARTSPRKIRQIHEYREFLRRNDPREIRKGNRGALVRFRDREGRNERFRAGTRFEKASWFSRLQLPVRESPAFRLVEVSGKTASQ